MAEQIGSFEAASCIAEIEALLDPAKRPKTGLPSDFARKGLLLLRSGDVRERAAARYPHIQCGGGDFPSLAGGLCGERRLA